MRIKVFELISGIQVKPKAAWLPRLNIALAPIEAYLTCKTECVVWISGSHCRSIHPHSFTLLVSEDPPFWNEDSMTSLWLRSLGCRRSLLSRCIFLLRSGFLRWQLEIFIPLKVLTRLIWGLFKKYTEQ